MKRWLAFLTAVVLLLTGCVPSAARMAQDLLSAAENAAQAEPPEWDGDRVPAQAIYQPPAYTQTGHSAVLQSQRYYRSQLSGNLLAAYDRMVFSAECLVNFIDVYDLALTEDELRLVFNSVVMDNPQLFYLSGGSTYWYYSSEQTLPTVFVINFCDGVVTDEVGLDLEFITEADKVLIDRRRCELEEIVAGFLRDVPPDTGDYAKELLAHDYVLDRVEYAYDQLEDPDAVDIYSLYGALHDGLAVCEGYSEAFQYLLQRMGMECMLCYGIADGQDHQWNIIRLGDSYCHVDPTWDDSSSLADLGLRDYFYFNLSDQALSQTHAIGQTSTGENIQQAPACGDNSWWYYNQVGIPLNADGTLPGAELMNSRARQALQEGAGYLFLVCPGGWTAARMEEWTARDEFWDLCDILTENGWNMPGDGVSYYILQDDGLIVIVL